MSPEFLAALPPSIQEEVLAQQRAEQARVAAESAAATTAQPDQSVDPAGFIQSLPPSLRQQVCLCMLIKLKSWLMIKYVKRTLFHVLLV